MIKKNSINKNDIAWNFLFEKYDIINQIGKNGFFEITADQINQFRESRLMTKFDHTCNLPQLFADNMLSILPISRGGYIISRFNAYHDFELVNSTVKKASLPYNIYSLSYGNINSESIALNCALASGIIADFIEDEELIPTVSGRMSSGKFEFDIKSGGNMSNRHISVENSQIEIDAAYEGINFLSLFEAKMDLSSDFLVRQLYYPFRTWFGRIPKKVKPIFLIYSNGIYRLYEYEFENPFEYNSIVLVKQQNYSLENTDITIEDIQEILRSVNIVKEPDIPFPQANSFERVINLCELLLKHDMSRNDVTQNYDFDGRQTNYYTDAARYLGLLNKNLINKQIQYSISSQGKNILKKSYKERQLAFCKLILSHKVFNDVLKKYLARGIMPEKSEIVALMKRANLYKLNADETFERRASTVKHWIEWIVELVNN